MTVLCAAQSATATDRRPDPPPLPTDRTALHERIDQLIEAAHPEFRQLDAGRSSDAEFFRRIHLDLAGTIPSGKETRAFLADTTPTDVKRERVIDRLLESPRHSRRMQYVFDVMLIERRTGAVVPPADWQEYLRQSFLENRPWNELAQEILSADGADPKQRAAARFYLDRPFNVDQVTRDVGRVFLGVDLECAQCHDHPLIDGYLQRHYYGISAFLNRSYLFTDSKTKKQMLGEKAEGDVKFTSVFTQEESGTAPRLLDLAAIPDPEGTAKAYLVKPDKKSRGIPQYSRRLQLARAMIADDNIDFRRNIVNRLWAVMMGRGLVEPLDVRHADNPATHPEVLELLADEFLRQRYNIRWLLRELALTKAYQRGGAPAKPNDAAAQAYAVALLKPLTPEQLAWSLMQATDVVDRTLEKQQAELLKKEPESGKAKIQDPAWQEAAVNGQLKSSVAEFVKQFAGQGGQKTKFETTPDQALFLINGPVLRGWLVPTNGNLTERLQKLEDSAAVAEELYICILGRRPSDDEAAEIAGYLESVEDRSAAAQELAWALLSSAEFRFNH